MQSKINHFHFFAIDQSIPKRKKKIRSFPSRLFPFGISKMVSLNCKDESSNFDVMGSRSRDKPNETIAMHEK